LHCDALLFKRQCHALQRCSTAELCERLLAQAPRFSAHPKHIFSSPKRIVASRTSAASMHRRPMPSPCLAFPKRVVSLRTCAVAALSNAFASPRISLPRQVYAPPNQCVAMPPLRFAHQLRGLAWPCAALLRRGVASPRSQRRTSGPCPAVAT
jgi:hypothetical protein